jgi:hypothetical protein
LATEASGDPVRDGSDNPPTATAPASGGRGDAVLAGSTRLRITASSSTGSGC